jgi:hypothetical protein
VRLPPNFKDLIDQQESLEAKRCKVLLQLESSNVSAEIQASWLLLLQMILASQATIAKDLLAECAVLTCENVEWPVEVDIRA